MKYLLLVFLVLVPTTVWAQPSPEYEKPASVVTLPLGPDKIKPIKKGKPAPYDGQLFDIDTSIRWGFWLQQYKYRLEADAKKYQQLCRVEVDFRDRSLVIEKGRNETVEKDLRDRLLHSEKARLTAEEEARNPPWYSTWTFGLVTGVVATAVIFGVAVAAIDASSR